MSPAFLVSRNQLCVFNFQSRPFRITVGGLVILIIFTHARTLISVCYSLSRFSFRVISCAFLVFSRVLGFYLHVAHLNMAGLGQKRSEVANMMMHIRCRVCTRDPHEAHPCTKCSSHFCRGCLATGTTNEDGVSSCTGCLATDSNATIVSTCPRCG